MSGNVSENTKMIYMASPYSSHLPDGQRNFEVEERNYVKAISATGHLMRKGALVYSPIVHWHVVDIVFSGEIGYEDYLAADLEMLRRCDEVHVLMADGWEKSNGIKVELSQANTFGKVVKYFVIDEEGVKYANASN